jgi:hypothetical protein
MDSMQLRHDNHTQYDGSQSAQQPGGGRGGGTATTAMGPAASGAPGYGTAVM